MLTTAQEQIIKEVCSIQFESLSNIFIQQLEVEYEILLESHGCSRRDYDESILKTRAEFKQVFDTPLLLFELSDIDMDIFVFILKNLDLEFKNKFPKAYENLLNKILAHQLVSNFEYLN